MKKMIIFSLIVLIISATLPLLVLEGNDISEALSNKITVTQPTETIPATEHEKDEASFDESDNNVRKTIICSAIEYLDDNSEEETKLAVLEICRNNYLYNELNSIPQETDVSHYSDTLYNELLSLYEEMKLSLSYKGEIRYIPLIHRGHLHSATDDEHPYLAPVATPWEAYNSDFEYKKLPKCGLSVYSLDYLISDGYDRKYALSYLLPQFTIK